MASKLQTIIDYAKKLTVDLAEQNGLWQSYLLTAARVYKYPFPEQLLIYGQRPEATACAPIELWNERMGRWVNRGAKGIALIDDSGERPRLKYVFDVSDTHPGNYRALTPRLWRMDAQYQDVAAEALANAFGSPDEAASFANHIIAVSRIAAQDNLADYLDELRNVRTDSFLEELDDLNLETHFRKLLGNSVAFTVLTRCGIDAGQFFENEDFDGLYDFNTFDTMTVLGTATSDVSRMLLLEIERTINGINRQKFANREQSGYPASKEAEQKPAEKEKEVGDHDANADVHDEGRVSVPRPDAPGADGGEAAGQVRPDAQEIPQAEQAGDVQPPAAVREADGVPDGDRPAGDGDGVLSDGANGADGGRDGEPESDGSDVVGAAHEQHPAESGGDRYEATDLQLSHHDFDTPSEIPYYYHDAEKSELLRTSDALKDHRAEIAAFFAVHEDSKERGNFVRSFFDNAFVEKTLSNDQRAGYRAYADVLNLWRGDYLTREREDFMRWTQVADSIYGMMLLDQWLDPGEKLAPATHEQLSLIAEAAADKDNAFALPQEAVDYILTAIGRYQKFRIYEYFQQKNAAADNIKFLKSTYGEGGRSDAIPGSSYWEDHGSKGITISNHYGEDKGEIVLSWKRVEKRIGELIAADRYLSQADKAAYPEYRREEETKAARRAISKEFDAIIDEYMKFVEGIGEQSKLVDRWYLVSCASAFSAGEKKMHARIAEGDFILPMMRDAMQTIIAEKTHLTERCEAILTALDGDLAKPLEPTYEELNPPSPPKKEYRFSLGDTVYLGTQQYELLAFDEQEVRLYDTQYPLFNKVMPREEFDRKIAKNPQNDHLLVVVDEQDAPPSPPLEPETPAPVDRGDVMLQQALLAAELSGQTGQNVFAFEEGNPLPVNVPLPAKPAEKEETLAPPAPKPRKKASPFLLHPEIPSAQRHEYRITDDQLGVGTPSERYARNVAAIRTLKQIEGEERLATPEEQAVLAQYVGWGGLADCFDDRNSHYAELKALLTDEEYAAARESTLTAFYTPPTVIRAVYKALDNMGFQSGNILEPSCGVGNFLGMKPEKLGDSKIYGVELDSISGRIARQLYQQSSIAVQGYEKTDIPDSFFDVALGNVPFGSFKVADKRYDRHNFLIHDYFFARTLDKVRPGGIIAFITSKGTMDKESIGVRRYIAQRADLLGAIRLPNTTFKGAAGTEVTSDIIFLQKRDTLMDIMPEWVHLGKDENGLTMNQYFIVHPEMILGEMREVSGPYGPETACLPYGDRDLDTLLSEAIQNINGDIGEYAVEELAEDEEDRSIPADPSVRNFSFCLVDGKVYYRQDSRMVPVDVSATAESRIKGLVGIRDCVRTLIEYQTEDYPDHMIAAAQQKLNRLYDDFVKHYGRIGSRANNTAFNSDSAYFLLSSLEVTDDEGNFVRKADMFSKRTIKQRVVVTSVDTASEALALSLAEKAKIDMEYMAELTGKSEEEIFSDLKGVIFLNPMHTGEDSTNAKYLTADEYLSGNVREKLQWAKRSAELYPDDYAPNVKALEAVQPADLTAAEISVRLGATWLPTDVVEQFIYELFSTPRYAQWKIKVHYSQYTGDWNVENKNYDRGNVKALSTYGTTRINGYKIVEETLNLRTVRIFDYVIEADGKRTPVLNKKETAIAQGKQELIKQAFQEWIWADQPRRERLCKLYNDKFNATRPREYDGSHLNFVGINPEITLRPHQVNAIAHILYGGNTLLAHVVGAGKTFEMVAAAQESKRLGLCQKSLFVVPNHLTEQWAAEYLQLYPSANILVATKKDFETKNRKRFCGRIATGDYDAIIIGHSQFEKIPMSAERQRALLEQQMDEIMAGIAELKENHGERFSIKQMERTKKSLQMKLDKLNDTSRKDDVVTFEELGVDRLFIDEAHYYKNLAAFSKMRNVGGISQTEAQKSSDLYMKCRYLDELTGGRGVVFATGTPISNSMVELYTMQKYLQYGTLGRNGLLHFDSWASTFGETVTAIELAPEGSGYRAKTRFAKFYNLPELMAMFKETADIQTADMLNLPVPKAVYHNVVLKPSEHQKEMVAGLSERAEKVRNKEVAPEVDNMLKITNDGRKLALDQRLMSELLPDSETGKVAACAANVFAIWQRTAAERSTQMVFCDLSTPHGDGQFNVYDDLRDKLIAKGIPAEEIAYIHNAKSEVQKKEMFGKVRSGQIRVLLGSTQKMGAGTNVQQKLIALHHLDCPWRPADLQQREGRIIRQGNENPEVEIFTYVTENTFDSYLYQLVEGKQKFIGQIMTSKSPVRAAEDIDETALSYAEIKALCTGNPHIKEKMDLDIDVQRLKLLKSSYLSQKYALEDQIVKSFPQQISALEQRIEGYTADMARVVENTHPNDDGFSPMVVEGKTYTEKKAAGSAILEVCHNMTSPDPVPLGQYRGFDMVLSFDSLSREYKITLKGELHHVTGLGTDIYGNIQRLDNLLSVLEERRTACTEQLENVKVQLESAKEQVARPFPQEEELKTKSARLDELNIMLDMDKKDSEVLDDGEISEEDAERNQPQKKDRGIER